jgi:predicted Rossmann-fold nucleotide-binding protein
MLPSQLYQRSLNPTVFISYSIQDEAHTNWVVKLAELLKKNGVQVVLDVWHLSQGDNVVHFMEKAVHESDYTLLICTPQFADKVNKRIGGVGFEAEMILGNLLMSFDEQIKVVPILKEGVPSDSIPRVLRSRLFIDFSDPENFNNSTEILLRKIFNAPKYREPELGNKPNFANSNNEAPHKWILVSGIGVQKHLNEKIVKTSDELGRLLAENNYGLITGGWPGVDEIVARSFSKHVYEANKALENFLIQVVLKSKLPAYSGGSLILVNEGADEWTVPVKRAHAIILIHGIGGTKSTGLFGLEYNKPVFPIADTDGDAKSFYWETINNWQDKNFKMIKLQKYQALGGEAPYVLRSLIELLKLEL